MLRHRERTGEHRRGLAVAEVGVGEEKGVLCGEVRQCHALACEAVGNLCAFVDCGA